MTTQPNQPNVGLTAKEVEASKQAHGENVLTPPKRTPLWKLYIEKYNDPIIKILLVAALVSLGYSQSEAALAVSKIDGTLPVEEIIKLALRGMAGRR